MAPRAGVGWIRAVVAALIMVVLPAASSGQYFGANKVRYKSLQFQVLETEHFDIYFHLPEREHVDIAGRLAERWWVRLSQMFGHEPSSRQPLVLYGSHVDFEQTLIVPNIVDAATGGLTEPWRRRIVMPFAGPLSETDHVIGHELVHAFQFDLMAGQFPTDGDRDAGALPLWFVEGMAEFLTIGEIDTHTAMWLRDAALRNDLPSIDDLDDPRHFPYRWGHAFWAYVAGRWGIDTVPALFNVASLTGVPAALERVLGRSQLELAADWHSAIRTTYPARPAAIAPLDRPLVAGRSFGGTTNVNPAISPDGRWIAFLSERSFFAIDLFVADARSGAVVEKLTDMVGDPHYSNLQFVGSAAAWDREGRRLAVGTVTSGRAAIAVFDWPGGHRSLEVVIEDVDEIYSPTWSPDGRSIAFSGISGGVTDLFVYDLERSSLRRLTDDAFADLQPAWEPDGRRIAFVTDRFTTDPGTLIFGAYRLALLDVDTGVIQQMPAFTTGKHLTPQWSPDGTCLYFVSDRDGKSDVYRLELSTGGLRRLTTAATGVSGITASSPALSVAAREGTAAVTAFVNGGFAIHTLASSAGEPVDAGVVPTVLRLPPIEAIRRSDGMRRPGEVPAGPATQEPVLRYRPRLSLEGISQAAFGVGMDRFGATVGTGLGLAFSDILNTHWLVAAVQLNQALDEGLSLRDTAAYGAYFNQVHRWNWGIVGSHIPFLVGVRPAGVPLSDGAVPVQPVSVIRQTERTATTLAAYPFSRARRVEFQGGVGRLSFDQTVVTGDERIEWVSAARPLTLGTISAAWVSDTTSFGATSVVRGERYRFEVAPTYGTIRYVNVLADYRRYVMPLPFVTVAARALHFGRYGAGADDPRIAPLYLGYPTLVRGYDLDTHITSDCAAVLSTGCEEIEQMLGSRVAVGNVELRFPLLRPFGVSSRMYGPLPVEVALFVDGGLAWREAPGTSGGGTTRGSAWSTGVTIRTSLFGFGLGQFDIVRPHRQSRPGWVFQFNLVPAI
jgi:hypothetical protein